MIQIGDKMWLSISSPEETRGRQKFSVKDYAEGTVIYIRPKNRFVVFDFGWFRESISPAEIPNRMERDTK
mgnify:FL=1